MLDDYSWIPTPQQDALKYKSGKTQVSDIQQIISHQAGMLENNE
jgi:hypothetical protein